MDAELEKEEPDFDFIEECTGILLEIQDAVIDIDGVVPFLYSDKVAASVKSNRLKFSKTAARAVLVAAILLATTITANAAITGVTGKSIIENIAIAVNDSSDKETTAPEEETTAKPPESTTSRRKKKHSYEHSKVQTTTQREHFGDGIKTGTTAPASTEPDDSVSGEADYAGEKEKTQKDKTEKKTTEEESVTQYAEPDISFPSDENETNE